MDRETNWLELEDFAEGLREQLGIPGLSIGILEAGEARTAGLGIGSVEKGSPVWGETVFQVGSISKTFTAALVMMLVEAGELDLDAPVRAYLPDFAVADGTTSAAVTLRHLLTHSAGWDGDFFAETGDGADALPAYVQRLAERTQLFEPGRYYSYNNSGFAVLGAVLEKVSGTTIETLLKERIFQPLDMQHAYVNAGEAITEDFVVGHEDGEHGQEVARPWRLPRAILPVGGIVTNAGDLLKYAAWLMRGGTTLSGDRLLSESSIMTIWTPELEIHPDDRSSVCLSWMRREIEGGFLVSHSGGTNGQVTYLLMVPGRRFAVAVLTNAEAGRRAIRKIAHFALKRYLGVEIVDPEPIDSAPDDLARYAGSAARPGFALHLSMMGDHLVGLSTTTVGFPTENDPPGPPDPPFRVGKCAEDRLIVLDGKSKGDVIDVLRVEGEIRFLRVWSRMYRWQEY